MGIINKSTEFCNIYNGQIVAFKKHVFSEKVVGFFNLPIDYNEKKRERKNLILKILKQEGKKNMEQSTIILKLTENLGLKLSTSNV